MSDRVRVLALHRKDFDELLGATYRTEFMLRQIPLLKSLSKEDLRELAREAAPVEFADGDEIMREGAAGDCMYVIVDGEVVVTVSGMGEVARKSRGDWFGFSSVRGRLLERTLILFSIEWHHENDAPVLPGGARQLRLPLGGDTQQPCRPPI